MADPAKILIVDDHPIVGQGMRSMLESLQDVHLLPLATSGEEAIEVCRKEEPAYVFMDVQLPGITGLNALKRIIARAPDTKVLGVSAIADRLVANQFIDAGGVAYVTKQSGASELKKAFIAVKAGQQYLSQDLSNQNHEAGRKRQAESPFKVLSKRETELVVMIANGLKVTDIAKALHLEAKTINTYRYRIYEKLNVETDVELTHLALRHKMVDIG